MPNSFYDTSTLVSAINKMVRPRSFLRDRYFPCNPATDIFSTEYVLIEIKDGNKKMAPFVTPIKGGVLMERDAVRMEQFAPPTIAPSRVLRADQLRKRGFGEALYAGLTPEQRAQQTTLQDIADLDDAITRREEKMAADIMFTNKCVMKHICDDPDKSDIVQLDFADNGNNGAQYTPSEKWTVDTPWELIEADINEMIKMLTRRGIEAIDIILGTNVALTIKNNKEFKELLDIKNLDAGALKAAEDNAGAALLGSIVIAGHRLNVFTYDETYEDDETGELKEFVPVDSICISAPSAGHMCYGSTVLLEGDAGNEDFVNYPNSRVPQYVSDRKTGVREIILHSHPLPLPKKVNPWVTAEVV